MKNFIWAIIEQVGSQLINILISLILALFIAPAEFGVFIIVTIIASLSYLFINLGFGKSLIKKKYPTEDDKNTVFLINFFIAILFSLAILLGSNQIAIFFNYPDLENYLYWVPIGFLFSSLGQVNLTLLTKELKFKQIFIAYLLSRILSGAIAIYLAYNNYGVWSLVVQQISSSMLQTLFTFYFYNWLPKFYFSKASYRELSGFSFNVFGTEFINYLVDNLDKLIIGKFLQQNVLGFYSRAYQLTMLPVQNFPRVVDKFLFPYLSKEGLSKSDLAEFYVKIIGLVSYILFPIVITFSFVSDDFVQVVFTEDWSPISPLIKIIAISAILVSLAELNTSFFLITDNSRQLLICNVVSRSLAIGFLFPALRYGIEGVVWVMVVSSLLRLILLTYFNMRIVRFSIKEYFLTIIITLLIICTSVCLTHLFSNLLNFQMSIISLLFKVISILSLYIMISYFVRYKQFRLLCDLYLKKVKLFE